MSISLSTTFTAALAGGDIAALQHELFHIAREGPADNIEKLVEAGAVIEMVDDTGWTPLQIAAQAGQADCVKTLIRLGAEINRSNSRGNTALHIAAQSGKGDVIRALVAAGADTTIRGKGDRTALEIAQFWRQEESESALHEAISLRAAERLKKKYLRQRKRPA